MAKRRKADERGEYGQGSIYPAPNGRFVVAVRIRKGEKPIRRRAANRQEAERIRDELVAQRDGGVRVDKALQSFEDYTNYWFNDVYLQRTLAERSQKHTLDMLELHILPAIGKKALGMIEADELQRLINHMKRRDGRGPLSAQTKQHVASLLKEMFRKAFSMGWIKRDPAADLEAPSINRTPKEAPTTAHVRALLATVDGHPHSLAYHIMSTLGTRLGETLALRRIDFSQDFSEVKIDTAINYHTLAIADPKRGSKRPLPVPPHLQAYVKAQWEHVKSLRLDTPDFNPLGYLIPSEVGTPIQPSNFEKAWNGYTQRRKTKKGLKEYTHRGFKHRAGIPSDTTIHSLRAYVATTLEDVDAPQRTIGHILGHGAKNVTEKYIRRSLPTMRRALERLEGQLWAGEAGAEQTG